MVPLWEEKSLLMVALPEPAKVETIKPVEEDRSGNEILKFVACSSLAFLFLAL